MVENPDQQSAGRAQMHRFYAHAMELLELAQVPYLVGGGYAMAHYTAIVRETKDLDLCLRPRHRDAALKALSDAGYRTEIVWPHFLGKALSGDAFVDIIYNSGNGLCPVDDQWFTHAHHGAILHRQVPICPVEEMIWPKAFVQDRDRYDGADVAHLILKCGRHIDWTRLIARFASHEHVLLAQALLFRYSYPSERDCVPDWALEQLLARARCDPPANQKICRGTNLAIRQYLTDVRQWGFADARLQPLGPLTPAEIDSLPAD
jgi:hypothetical protein